MAAAPPFAFDIERARRETRDCGRIIHFNNAGAALSPDCVVDAVIDHLRLEARIGSYEAAANRTEALEATYVSLATLLNCRPDEIALAESATRAWDMLFFSMPLKPGDRVLTSRAEYASNYIAYLQRVRREGIIIDIIPDDVDGVLSVDALAGMIDDRVKLISITHVPTNGGLINPIEQIGEIARRHRVPFLVDASQSVGQVPIDVQAVGCDMLVGCGRKYLRGPRGTGFLYVGENLLDRLDPIFLDLLATTWTGPDSFEIQPGARRFESWESCIAGRLGLGVAVDYALGWGIEAVAARVADLAATLRDRLSALDGVQVRDLGRQRCGLVSFSFQGADPEELQRDLNGLGANVDVSYASSTLIDMSARRLPTLMRASVHYYNTADEVEAFCTMLDTLRRR